MKNVLFYLKIYQQTITSKNKVISLLVSEDTVQNKNNRVPYSLSSQQILLIHSLIPLLISE